MSAVVIILSLTTTATYMVLPFLVLFLTRTIHLSFRSAGLALALLVIVQRGGAFAGGIASDRYSPRAMMIAGLAASACGYLSLSLATGLPAIGGSLIVLGIGTALFLPACKAVLAVVAEEIGPRAFAVRTTVTNGGSALGPLIGGALFSDFKVLLLVISLLHILCCYPAARANPLGRREAKAPPPAGSKRATAGFRGAVADVATDPLLLGLVAASVGFWICYTQFDLTIPMYAAQVLWSPGAVGLLTTLNSVAITVLQLPLLKRVLTGPHRAVSLLTLGMLIMTCAFVPMILASGIIALVVFTLLFSLSELLVAPCLDAAADSLAGPRRRATYLGFVSVGWAVGAVVGNSVGVQTFNSGSPSWHHSVSWFSFTLTAAAGALAFGAMRREYRRRQPSAAARVPDVAPESPQPVPGGRPE